MKRIIITSAFIWVPFVGFASEKDHPKPTPPPPAVEDSWTGSDKVQHLFGGALVAGVVTVGTEKPLYGFAAGCGFGAVKELADRSSTGFSGKDLAVTCLGAGLGALGANWLITRQGGKTTVSYFKEF